MISDRLLMILCGIGCAIILVLAVLATRINLKKNIRSRQILMPFVGLAYGIAAGVILVVGDRLITRFVNWILNFLERIPLLGSGLASLIRWIEESDLIRLLIFFSINILFLLIYMLLKGILIKIMKRRHEKRRPILEKLEDPFYVKDESSGLSFLRKNWCQARALLKAVNITLIIAMPCLTLLSCRMFLNEWLDHPLSPVIVLILIGEVAYILGGRTREEQDALEGEDDRSRRIADYSLMKNVLRNLFPDKLSSWDTSLSLGPDQFRTNREVLDGLEEDDRAMIRNYGSYLDFKMSKGMALDHHYVEAGKELLEGNSILFNNPFYYDLIPYIFYPMNRRLLSHKKVLVVLGRLGIEDEIEAWCREGLVSVNNTPTLWNIGIILEEEQDLDVGILTRSRVLDLELHKANAGFLREVGMMILIEPSRLMTTAQIGLNSLVRYAGSEEKKPVYCSIDKNCDGLLDALSHVLMVSLGEISATEHPAGRSTYMCWDGDSDHLQHRLLPNLSRYLGFGTELSFAALKNQISEAWWYGGDAFPVTDVSLIAKQYHYDLLKYASLPASQETMDEKFHVVPSMWGAREREYQYLTVEDESSNLYEIRREFASRAVREGFVNVIAPEYMVKDYMTSNDAIFRADPKAIPYIVADYALTRRNVVLRLCLRMTVDRVWESELRQDLLLIDAPVDDLEASLWHEICQVLSEGRGVRGDVLAAVEKGRTYSLRQDDVLSRIRKYNVSTGRIESCYSVINPERSVFVRLFVAPLKSAEYVAEDEMGRDQYLGSEILGQVDQRHLPGQFFTITGKYYEMLRVNQEGRVVLRRASDHITGRESYRQVREYTLSRIEESSQMGDVKSWDGMQVAYCYADITVRTPAYWRMDRYNDFVTGKRVEINGVRERIYRNKRILKIGFENCEGSDKIPVTKEICRTLTVLINELFVTLFAENQGFLAALMPGAQGIPLTYTLDSSDDDPEGTATCASGDGVSTGPEENCIYIVEDSELDIGLLEAVERNLDRIFSILCDYLDWEIKEDAQSRERSEGRSSLSAGAKMVQAESPQEEADEDKKLRGPFKRLRERIRKRRKRRSGKSGEEKPETQTTMTSGQSAAETAANGRAAGLAGSVASGADRKERACYDRTTPYHERAYLLYGGTEKPASIQEKSTEQFLCDRGYGHSELRQAREGENISGILERNSLLKGLITCDFCGITMTGTEYETLQDGRNRCMNCSRTAIKTEKEFSKLFRMVRDTMQSLFGIQLDVSITVKMVDAQKLSRALGKSFVPTGNHDGRVLGVAISSRKGYTLLLENGSPKISSALTMAHELTHIWQYENWNQKQIRKQYGKKNELLIYEGMAEWVEIQYAYLIGESATAMREEVLTRMRDDEYGQGFQLYESQYPISEGTTLDGNTPFMQIPPLK